MQLPFPQEHPYASHTPHFAMFPDVHPHPTISNTTTTPVQTPTTSLPPILPPSHPSGDHAPFSPVVVHTGTQAPEATVGVPHPPWLYYVSGKAVDQGRVEQRYVGWLRPGLPVVKEKGEILCDLPRSQRHRVRELLCSFSEVKICTCFLSYELSLSRSLPRSFSLLPSLPLSPPSLPLIINFLIIFPTLL